MKITEIQIHPIKPQNGLVAIASVVFDNCLYLGSIGVHTRLDGAGLRITYPTKKIGYKDMNIYHPISRQVSDELEAAIIEKAYKILDIQ